jgi:protein TonB
MPRDVMQMQPEPFGRPAAGSVLLHVAAVGALFLLIYMNGKFRGDQWSTQGPQGAIQATLVNSAPSIPLPSITPPTPNVLATDLPSPSPAPPSKATIPVQEPDAIPIATHEIRRAAEKPHPASPQHAQPTNQQNRANYGEAAASQLNHAMTTNAAHSNSPVTVSGGDFASRFPWYVDKITRMVSQNWYTQQIDGSTRIGSQANVTFTVGRDGRVSSIHITAPSNSPTLNTTAMQAVQRVESFGPLPDQYTGSSVSVEYTFTYDTPGK